jgi:uncharacterized protein (DUF4415 family)
MKKNGNIVRYTSTELLELSKKHGIRSDLARLDAMTEEELEKAIAEDEDWRDIPRDWYKDAIAGIPLSKKLISLRIDADIVDWFKKRGAGYQTRMNAVLRAFVQQQDAKPTRGKSK